MNVKNAFIVPSGKVLEIYLVQADHIFDVNFFKTYQDIFVGGGGGQQVFSITEKGGASSIYPCILTATWDAGGNLLGYASSPAPNGFILTEDEACLEMEASHTSGSPTYVRWRDVTPEE